MKVVCSHCGLPFSVARPTANRAVFCCSGCALAARVPVDEKGQFPVNGPLITALTIGFVGFNQILFWLLAELLARRAGDAAGSEAVNATRFMWASLGVGATVWLAIAAIQWRLGARRAVDLAVLALSGATLGVAVATQSPVCALGANAGLAAWAMRGLRRKPTPGK